MSNTFFQGGKNFLGRLAPPAPPLVTNLRLNEFLGEKDLCFYYMFKTIFSGQNKISKFWECTPPVDTGLLVLTTTINIYIFL